MLTLAFNIVSIVALIFPLYRIISIEYNAARTVSKYEGVQEEFGAYQFQNSQPLPDIYYIVLDAYGRDDTLSQYFLMDNTIFLSSLENTGSIEAWIVLKFIAVKKSIARLPGCA